MGSVLTIYKEDIKTNEKIELFEIRRNNFLNEWFENNLEYFNENDEEHEINIEDFKNLKSELEEALKLNYKEAKELFYEINEEDYKEEIKEIIEIVNKCLSYEDINYFYYSFYF